MNSAAMVSALLHHRAVRILLLTLAYCVTAKLGLLLAIAPGYATPVWPASGIAVGTLLLWPELWPAVWLGSFCTNLSIAFDSTTSASLLRSITLPAVIGAGALLQAQAGRLLVRRFLAATPQLTNEREVFRFLLLAGPLACLLNASWSVLVLVASGEIPAAGFAFTWGTWWIGDTIGVLIFAPLTYMWASHQEQWRARRWAVTVPLTIMFALALLVFVYTTRLETREGRQHFDKDAALVTASMQRRIDLGIETIHALAGLFASSDGVDSAEFQRFTSMLFARHGELHSVFWVPRIAASETMPSARVATSSVPIAAANVDTFPIGRFASHGVAVVDTGTDLARDPALRAALAWSSGTGRDVSVPAGQLFGNASNIYVVLVPLYQPSISATASASERRAHLLGFAAGTFDVERLAATILREEPAAPQLSWRLEDRDRERVTLMHRLIGPVPRSAQAAEDLQGWEVHREVRIADREWVFEFEPTLEYIASRSHLIAWLVLSGGLLLTVLIGAGALIVTGRTMTIKAEVQTRTEELARINDQLANEVCDHIRTEETLDREREFLKAVFDNLSEGIIVLNSDNRVTMANRAAHLILMRILGTAAALEEGWNARTDVYHADGRTPLDPAELPRARAFRGETVRDFELVLRYGMRAPVRLLVTAQPLLNPDKRRPGVIAVLRDITDAQKVEQLKREFVATVSHELRTPLTSICGSLGLLASGKMAGVSDKAQHLVEMALRNTERLTFLINDLLDIEKIEQGAMKFDLSEQSLDALVQQAVEAQQGAAQASNVRVRVQGDTAGRQVFVDPQRLLQVLANLLSNAIKFSPPQSEVLVQLRCDEHDCHVSIHDRGPGIPLEFRERIFQKFSQADSSDARTKGGTGLGLAISKALIERMGGTIGYDSPPGCGATFFFRLPAGGDEGTG